MVAGTRIEWDEGKIAFITEAMPEEAHLAGVMAAAQAAAEAIDPQYPGTGHLAADVRTPQFVSALSATVGSSLPYARIQHEGGTIRARSGGRLLIHGIDTGDGGYQKGRRYAAGTAGGIGGQFATQDVVASADEVTIPAKRYLDAAPPVYEVVVTERMKELFPR